MGMVSIVRVKTKLNVERDVVDGLWILKVRVECHFCSEEYENDCSSRSFSKY